MCNFRIAKPVFLSAFCFARFPDSHAVFAKKGKKICENQPKIRIAVGFDKAE